MNKVFKNTDSFSVRPDLLRDKLKLLHITSSLKMGGAEHILHTIASNLNPQKFDQHIIYFHEGPYLERFKALNIPMYKISGVLFRYDPIFFYRLYRMIKQINPHCVHTLLWVANFAGRLCAWLQRMPCVSVFHNNVGIDGKIRNAIDWLTLRFADRLVAVSQPVADSVQARFGCAKKIEVIENGINIDPNSSAVAKKAMEDTVDTFIIGAVGRFEPVKRYDVLLTLIAPIMRTHSHVRLCLIGVGSQEQALRALAHELGIADRVQFLIGVPAIEYYHLFDCFVQTTAAEGISLALLEAMSFGVPSLVMHDTPHHPVIVHNQNGLMVDASDFEGFGRCLEGLMRDIDLRERLGAEGQKTVRDRFDARVMVRKYADIFSNSF